MATVTWTKKVKSTLDATPGGFMSGGFMSGGFLGGDDSEGSWTKKTKHTAAVS